MARRSPPGPASSACNPMRYSGGLLGGALPALMLADLSAGEFDGAHLVSNFEPINPGRNFSASITTCSPTSTPAASKFLAFEGWWGGFDFLNESEIRWILEQSLPRQSARRAAKRGSNTAAHRSQGDPRTVIVFASRGDTITPPQQALNWIVDTYADEQEIKIRGQRIIYMVHEIGRPSRHLRLLARSPRRSTARSSRCSRRSRRCRPDSMS